LLLCQLDVFPLAAVQLFGHPLDPLLGRFAEVAVVPVACGPAQRALLLLDQLDPGFCPGLGVFELLLPLLHMGEGTLVYSCFSSRLTCCSCKMCSYLIRTMPTSAYSASATPSAATPHPSPSSPTPPYLRPCSGPVNCRA